MSLKRWLPVGLDSYSTAESTWNLFVIETLISWKMSFILLLQFLKNKTALVKRFTAEHRVKSVLELQLNWSHLGDFLFSERKSTGPVATSAYVLMRQPTQAQH